MHACMQVRLLGAEQIRGREHYTAYKLQRLGDADKHGQREPEGKPLYRRFRQFVQLVASLLEVRAAAPCGGGCNPMWRRLQPHVLEAAAPCVQAVTPMYPAYHPMRPAFPRYVPRSPELRAGPPSPWPSLWPSCEGLAPQQAQSAVSVVPQLTAPASWGGLARLLAAVRTPEERLWHRPVLPAACANVAPIFLPLTI